jgi:hypothetical protein
MDIVVPVVIGGVSFCIGWIVASARAAVENSTHKRHINHLLGWVAIMMQDKGEMQYMATLRRFHDMAMDDRFNISVNQELDEDCGQVRIWVRIWVRVTERSDG